MEGGTRVGHLLYPSWSYFPSENSAAVSGMNDAAAVAQLETCCVQNQHCWLILGTHAVWGMVEESLKQTAASNCVGCFVVDDGTDSVLAVAAVISAAYLNVWVAAAVSSAEILPTPCQQNLKEYEKVAEFGLG